MSKFNELDRKSKILFFIKDLQFSAKEHVGVFSKEDFANDDLPLMRDTLKVLLQLVPKAKEIQALLSVEPSYDTIEIESALIKAPKGFVYFSFSNFLQSFPSKLSDSENFIELSIHLETIANILVSFAFLSVEDIPDDYFDNVIFEFLLHFVDDLEYNGKIAIQSFNRLPPLAESPKNDSEAHSKAIEKRTD